ncbi:hypothetical protein PAHAL_4G268300 [Panicum hallii]|uniref:Uncharacterized protein n=1 Tax=Panicum hallii TaxID=206008 RepID=A0A2S3HKH1_9POAL|nr:hypothetical protein PAHAL_4G268300 [Panicum hallii]
MLGSPLCILKDFIGMSCDACSYSSKLAHVLICLSIPSKKDPENRTRLYYFSIIPLHVGWPYAHISC